MGSSALAWKAGGCRAQPRQPRSRRAERHSHGCFISDGKAICAVSVALSSVPRRTADLAESSCACDAPVRVLLWDSWKSPGSALVSPAWSRLSQKP